MSTARLTCLSLALAATLSLPGAQAITIDLDYSLDSNGFFSQQERRDALRAAADFYEDVLGDSLSEIRPTGQNTWSLAFYHPATDEPHYIDNPTIPADTIRIYVGGFDMPGGAVAIGGPGGWDAVGVADWLDTIDTRGNPGGGTTTGTDFTPWGGSIAFDTSEPWHFSTTTASLPGTSFVSTALHELGHVLGLGSAGAWENLISFPSIEFTGPETVARYGSPVPVSSDLGHFRDDGVCDAAFSGGFDPGNPNNVLSRTFAMFGTPAGREQIAAMDPNNCSVGDYIKVLTEIDLAALDDIGWDVTYPASEPAPVPTLSATVDPETRHVTLSWQTAPGHTYQLQENPGLAGWVDIGGIVEGDGTTALVTDTSPPVGSNNYRVGIDPRPYNLAPPPEPEMAKKAKSPGLLSVLKRSRPAVVCRDCAACVKKR